MAPEGKPPGLVHLLFSPVDFMEARVGSPPSVGGAAGIFLLFLIPTIVTLAALSGKVLDAVPDVLDPDMVKALKFFFTLSVVSNSVAGIVLWIVGSGMLTCLSIIFDGDAEYRKLLELTGYAFLPLAIVSMMVMFWVLPQDLDLDFKLDAGMSEQAVNREMQERVGEALSTTGFRIVKSCNFLAMIWTIVLMVLALKYAGHLSTGKSVLSLVLMGLFFLLVQYLRAVINPWGM